METTMYRGETRVLNGFLADAEKRALIWMARRLPAWINADHLTALALISMLGAGLSFWLARRHEAALVAVVVWLALNWLGDSLDGTLARVRRHERPRYGFYLDHVLDGIGTLFLLGGLALSGYMTPVLALLLLIVYYLLSIEVYLATHTLGTFRISYWKFGPTELRVVLALGTLALLFQPTVTILGAEHLLFDVGAVAGIAGMALILILSIVTHAGALYRAEPLPDREDP
jgi:archaetidylinositol phosphate synthase